MILSALCEARALSQASPSAAAAAAARVLCEAGVLAELAAVGVVALNQAAVNALPEAGSLPALLEQIDAEVPSPDRPFAIASGDWPLVVVNAGGTLLALGLDMFAEPAAGLSPQPLFAELPYDFWRGGDAVLLAGEDGSGIFVWATPEADMPAASAKAVAQEFERLNQVLAQIAG